MERKDFLRNSLGFFGAGAVLLNGCKKDTSLSGSSSAAVTGLTCGSVGYSGYPTNGTAFSGTASVPYTGGNSAAYAAGTAIASTGVLGLTATLQAGTLGTTGSIVYAIAGTPTSAGTAGFAITFGGQSCSLSLTVNAAGTVASCVVAATETAGPYPTITPASYVRSDITDGQSGVPLTIKITITNANKSCAALSGALVDIWHCTAVGYYSEYTDGPGGSYATINYTSSHFLRGRQTTDSNGLVTFTSIFPGWYSGRAPHIHVHVYNSSGTSLLITQIAFPTDVCNTVYTTATDYKAHGVQDTSNTADTIFSDSLATELATVTGSVSAGYVLTMTIPVSA